MIENVLLGMAQRGQMSQKIDEHALINIMKSIQETAETKQKTTITVVRKRQNFDSDEDY
ncbi:hypothetical protein HZS_1542 [Henneguya salminicola]|nr:hypothetical protein HZS_1542 [Henneguya salminicola]